MITEVLRAGRMTHWMDEARRQVGRALDGVGLGPQETPHRVVAEWPGARLRAYHDQERADGPASLLPSQPAPSFSPC
jgi:polyhydroxyalkanoate synthase subunit PhaC